MEDPTAGRSKITTLSKLPWHRERGLKGHLLFADIVYRWISGFLRFVDFSLGPFLELIHHATGFFFYGALGFNRLFPLSTRHVHTLMSVT